jgi:hypothetical protein
MDGGQDCSDTNIDSEIKSCNVDPCPIGTVSQTFFISTCLHFIFIIWWHFCPTLLQTN